MMSGLVYDEGDGNGSLLEFEYILEHLAWSESNGNTIPFYFLSAFVTRVLWHPTLIVCCRFELLLSLTAS